MEQELFSAVDSKFHKLGEMDAVSDKIAHSLGDEFYSKYDSFIIMAFGYTEIYTDFDRETWTKDECKVIRNSVIEDAGILHNMLNEKLISIRDH